MFMKISENFEPQTKSVVIRLESKSVILFLSRIAEVVLTQMDEERNQRSIAK
jgi:hypothetical protein